MRSGTNRAHPAPLDLLHIASWFGVPWHSRFCVKVPEESDMAVSDGNWSRRLCSCVMVLFLFGIDRKYLWRGQAASAAPQPGSLCSSREKASWAYRCTVGTSPCLSPWERWQSAARAERENNDHIIRKWLHGPLSHLRRQLSQRESWGAGPCYIVCWHEKMERICIDTLH